MVRARLDSEAESALETINLDLSDYAFSVDRYPTDAQKEFEE
jgi:hypothetical protein